MSRCLLLVLVLLAGIKSGCCPSSRQVDSSAETSRHAQRGQIVDSPVVMPRSPRISQSTAIKPNASLIQAVVDSVVMVDSESYILSVRVQTAEAVNGMENLATAGEQLSLIPQFIRTETDAIDQANPTNRQLLRLRTAWRGDTVRGRISLSLQGNWVIVKVEN